MDDNKRNDDFDQGIEEERDTSVFDEETAAEIADPDVEHMEDHDGPDANVTSAYGWVAVALSVLAFFVAPVLFAAAGIIVGIVARQKSAPILGNTAIAVGVLALLARFFIMPMI